ncbi:MAG: SapC family protein [Proteobacteria bacterium]|nr:SapC family protein [Pseudomonadota bacterium]
METQTVAGAPQLSGNVLFYSKPEPLTKEQHGALGVKQSATPYAFTRQANVVPLVVTEFTPAALSYPVIFAGDAKLPVAVMGISHGENLFVDDNGVYDPDSYLPAYVRRYPFVFANDQTGERLIVCIDTAAEAVGENPDAPFFVNGEPSEFTQSAIRFCEDFETERRRTESFVEVLKELDLFDVKRAMFTPRNADGTVGEPQQIAEYFGVSEEKLNALPAEKLVELRDNGALGQIYAHLISLQGWDRLIARALIRAQNRPTVANA